VIPTYNEAENLKKLLPQVAHLVKKVIVVDDNSIDGTASVAKVFGKNVYVIVRPRKMGLNSAIYFGALNTDTEYVAVMDADLSHPPETLKKMLKYVNDFEIIIGTRRDIQNWTLKRNLISLGAKLLTKPFVRNIQDPISGFFIAKREIILKYGRFAPPEGYKILFTILRHYIKKHKDIKIKEVLYTFNNRQFGKSKLGKKQILLYIFNVVSNFFYAL